MQDVRRGMTDSELIAEAYRLESQPVLSRCDHIRLTLIHDELECRAGCREKKLPDAAPQRLPPCKGRNVRMIDKFDHHVHTLTSEWLRHSPGMQARGSPDPYAPAPLSPARSQLSPAYEWRPETSILMMKRLNSIATKPAMIIQAARVSRQPEVARACREAA